MSHSKVAVISDVHANYQALQAVLAHADNQGVTDVWFLGDAVGYGPDPHRCLELLTKNVSHPNTCWVLGNHDKALCYPPNSVPTIVSSDMNNHVHMPIQLDPLRQHIGINPDNLTAFSINYEILEVSPDASAVEIQQAYEHAKETFQRDSVAVYSLFSEKEMEKIQAAVEEAYRILIDETSRRNYDQAHPSSPSLKSSKPERLPEAPESPMGKKTYLPFSEISIDLGEGPYRGKMLKQVRERMGVDLKTVSMETKISLKILQRIEEESTDQLPAMVYLRGFLKGYAQCLGLDPKKVIEDYLNFLGPNKKK